jgi:hypothetical protein
VRDHARGKIVLTLPESAGYRSPAFTRTKRCMYQPRIVRGASGKYSRYVDALVVWSSATVLAMNDRLPPPGNDRSSPRPEGVTPFRSFSHGHRPQRA